MSRFGVGITLVGINSYLVLTRRISYAEDELYMKENLNVHSFLSQLHSYLFFVLSCFVFYILRSYTWVCGFFMGMGFVHVSKCFDRENCGGKDGC